jgi:hypothetical protein
LQSTWEWQNYEVLLERMLELIRAHGATPVFVIECARSDLHDYTGLWYSALAAERLRRQGVAICDPRPAFAAREGEDLFYVSGVHVTARGARLLAREVFTALQALPPGRAALPGRADQVAVDHP